MPWNREKVLKKGFKHILFLGLSFLIANTFLAYVIGKDELYAIVTVPPSEHLAGFIAITIFSFVFYGVFARFREQVCLVACPYGRFQSVLVDNDSLAVTYDFGRGENRAKVADRQRIDGVISNFRKMATDLSEPHYGDCIDCEQCVKVCPTGIDIRNGIQLECINCTACMDACDDVMRKIGKPEKLITHTSFNAVTEGVKSRFFTPRIIAYFGVFVVLFTLFLTLLFTRADVNTVILRQPGSLYNELPDNRVSNLYQVRFFNKTFSDTEVELRLLTEGGTLQLLGQEQTIPGQQQLEQRWMVLMDKSVLTSSQTPIEFGVFKDGELIQTIQTGFLSPITKQ